MTAALGARVSWGAAAQGPLDLLTSFCPTVIPWGLQGWDSPSWGTPRASPHTPSLSLMGFKGGSPGQNRPMAMALPHSADLGTVFRVMGTWSQCWAPARARPSIVKVRWDRTGTGCEEGDGWQRPRCPSGDARGKRNDWRSLSA